jgi:rod shape-determining protein MreD
MAERRRGMPWQLLVAGSFAIAFVLTAAPAPAWAAGWRPPWVLLTLIHWCLTLPQRVGIVTAVLAGALTDVLLAAPLGQHALANTVVAWVVLLGYRRARMVSAAQQTLYVAGLLVLHRAVGYLVLGVSGRPPADATFWAPVLSGTLLWPWLAVLLRGLGRRSAPA